MRAEEKGTTKERVEAMQKKFDVRMDDMKQCLPPVGIRVNILLC